MTLISDRMGRTIAQAIAKVVFWALVSSYGKKVESDRSFEKRIDVHFSFGEHDQDAIDKVQDGMSKVIFGELRDWLGIEEAKF